MRYWPHLRVFQPLAVVFALACSLNRGALAAAQTDEHRLQLILELLNSPDRDTRGLALQQVREGLTGQTATRLLSDALPAMQPDAQSALLGALADRGDTTARPAILRASASSVEAVRIAAIQALGALGGSADARILAEKAASGSNLEKVTARRALVRLHGSNVNASIVTLLSNAPPLVRIEAIGALAARRARECADDVLGQTAHSEPAVRLAALSAAEALAGAPDAPALLSTLASAKDAPERTAAENALLAVCRRDKKDCLDAVLRALAKAKAGSAERVPLLRALAVIGGSTALEVLSSFTPDDDVIRLLSDWPDPSAAPRLLKIARETANPLHRILALRGAVRLASPEEQHPADVALLLQAWPLAQSADEKRAVVSALARSASASALPLLTNTLDEPGLLEEAALASVTVAEKLGTNNAQQIRVLIQRVLDRSRDRAIQDRARHVIERLDSK